MKARKPTRTEKKPEHGKVKEALKRERVDHLGITRGQNAEKGNTVKEDQIRDEGVVSH